MPQTPWKKIDTFLLLGVLAFTLFWIASDFLVKPFIWSDEALNIQMARSLAEFGQIGIPLAPGVFSSNLHYYTSSTGWVMLASVGLVFKFFGTSFFVARSVMAAYMLGAIAILFLLVRRYAGARLAAVSCLLIASFAPFLGNGKSVLGEIPGLFWLLLGLLTYELLEKKGIWKFIGSGLCIGLFLATKPAFLMLAAPPLALVHLIEVAKKRMSIKSAGAFWISASVMILPTVWLGSIHPLDMEHLQKTAFYYSNNYNSPCIQCDIQRNIQALLTQTTFWHLEVLAIAAIVWLVVSPALRKDWRVRWLGFFGALAFIYFMKSPGTNRYFLPTQLMLLSIFPVAVSDFVHRWSPRLERLVVPGLLCLVALQSIQYAKFSDTYPNAGPPELERFIQTQLLPKPGQIGVINAPTAGAAIPRDRMTQFIQNNAYERTDGVNILTQPQDQWPPTIIYQIHSKNARDIDPYLSDLQKVYTQRRQIGSFVILTKEL